MGALHPFEQALTLLLAFGPFVVLGIVVWLRRRADDAADQHLDEAVRERDSGAPESPSRTAPPTGRPTDRG